jgi:hypothetical protein
MLDGKEIMHDSYFFLLSIVVCDLQVFEYSFVKYSTAKRIQNRLKKTHNFYN